MLLVHEIYYDCYYRQHCGWPANTCADVSLQCSEAFTNEFRNVDLMAQQTAGVRIKTIVVRGKITKMKIWQNKTVE